MAFRKMKKSKYPPRQWSLVGFPEAGKTTFAAQMRGPVLAIDADQRFSEVLKAAAADVLQLSSDPADNVNARRIVALLHENMGGAGVGTIVVDSLTSIITPLVVKAILANDAGENKNHAVAFKPKSMAMRLLQDAVTAYGTDVLWIYHWRDGIDSKAKSARSTSISAVELARLRRSLNMQLSMFTEGNKRFVCVEWARSGRSGITLEDETGRWAGMPEKIEEAVYNGLSEEERDQITEATPTSFSSKEEAIAWAWEKLGAFKDALHAQNAYEKLKREEDPNTSSEMWALWIGEVERRAKNAVAS